MQTTITQWTLSLFVVEVHPEINSRLQLGFLRQSKGFYKGANGAVVAIDRSSS
jgi:hypothetical protein